MIRIVSGLDTNTDGSFGALPLKPCFRMKLSLFSTDLLVVDMFIKNHLLGNHSNEDLPKYMTAVVNMCSVFEDGLANSIKTLGGTDDKGNTVKDEEKVIVRENKRRRRSYGHGPNEARLHGKPTGDRKERRQHEEEHEEDPAAVKSDAVLHSEEVQPTTATAKFQKAETRGLGTIANEAIQSKKKHVHTGSDGQRAVKKVSIGTNLDSQSHTDSLNSSDKEGKVHLNGDVSAVDDSLNQL